MKQAKIYYDERLAGILTEDDNGFSFYYDNEYLADKNARPVSLTLPLRQDIYRSEVLFPFFDGLIPEGWLLNIAQQSWKLNIRDRMSILLACCKDCIGNISVREYV